MNINVLGIDLAKHIFQCCAMDNHGKIVKEQQVRRKDLLEKVSEFSPKMVAMEACGGANCWARELTKRGFTVKIMPAYYVKPYVKGNKNDKQDARAIAEACLRPTMRFVSAKSETQQDMQSLLRIRESYQQMRTKVSNQLYGLLAEYGEVMSKSISQLKNRLPTLYDRDNENGLSGELKALLEMQYRHLVSIETNIKACDKQISQIAQQTESCQRLQAIEGIGELTAVAISSRVGDVSGFKNGRHFAAYLGLVPRQHSSGGKERLMGISKRGDSYLRSLLVHGGRSVVKTVDNKTDERSLWVSRIKQERGYNKAAVAVANKNARIIFAMLKSGDDYRKAA
jgi:transposase